MDSIVVPAGTKSFVGIQNVLLTGFVAHFRQPMDWHTIGMVVAHPFCIPARYQLLSASDEAFQSRSMLQEQDAVIQIKMKKYFAVPKPEQFREWNNNVENEFVSSFC